MKHIAETAWHHDGDFPFLMNLTRSIAEESQTDYIKFHITLDLDEYMLPDHKAYKWAKSRIFDHEQWAKVFEAAVNNDKKLMLLFNDKKAIDFGMSFSPELVEIHSVCLNDSGLLKHLKKKISEKTKIVLGVGGSSLDEIEHAINLLETNNIVLMHGFQNYPTKYNDINFNKIKRIMLCYPEFEHGYADHTDWNNENNILITILGAAIGTNYLEKHVTTRPGEERTDWQSAISISEFNEIKNKTDLLMDCLGDGLLHLNDGEKAYSIYGPMKKAAILVRDVKKGELIDDSVFEFRRTSQISDMSQLDILSSLNKKFIRNIDKGSVIKFKDIV